MCECLDGYIFSIEGEGIKRRTAVYLCADCHPEMSELYCYMTVDYLRRIGKLHDIHDIASKPVSRREGLEAFRKFTQETELPF
jgi:predicted RNA-binding protein with EMAP domain